MTETNGAPYIAPPGNKPPGLRDARWWVKAWWALFFIVAAAFLALLLLRDAPFAVEWESSLWATFHGAKGFLEGCAQAAGILSLGSVIISLILQNLERQTLGFPLRELMSRFFWGYYGVFACTLAASLLCVGTARWGKLLATIVLLVAIGMCCGVHLAVLYQFVFRGSRRRDRALREWERRIAKSTTPEEAVDQSYGVSNAILAEARPYDPRTGWEGKRSLYGCFAKALRRAEAACDGDRRQAIRHMAAAWLYILRQEPPLEKQLFLLKSALRTSDGRKAPDQQAIATALLAFFCAQYRCEMEKAKKGVNAERLFELQDRLALIWVNMREDGAQCFYWLYGAYAFTVLARRASGALDTMSRDLLHYLPLVGDGSAPGGDADLFKDALCYVVGNSTVVQAIFPRCVEMLANMDKTFSWGREGAAG